ncbi:DNA-directed RNA polymerase subunit L [Candidatus Micrarchaeota archaeon]|nr:DNA-directed RNA polymerase subunit L [Candidatus Micrarchaeota archaeon]
MKLNIKKKEASYIEVELVGEDHSFPNLLRDTLLSNKHVEFASYVLEHPQVASPVLIVRTDGKSPIAVLKDAVKEIEENVDSFKGHFKKKK